MMLSCLETVGGVPGDMETWCCNRCSISCKIKVHSRRQAKENSWLEEVKGQTQLRGGAR